MIQFTTIKLQLSTTISYRVHEFPFLSYQWLLVRVFERERDREREREEGEGRMGGREGGREGGRAPVKFP